MKNTRCIVYKGKLYKQSRDNSARTVTSRCIRNLNPVFDLLDKVKDRMDMASKAFNQEKEDVKDGALRAKIESFFKKTLSSLASIDSAVKEFARDLSTAEKKEEKEEEDTFLLPILQEEGGEGV